MNYNQSKSNKNINSINDNKWNNDKFSKTVAILLSVAHRRFFVCLKTNWHIDCMF